NFPQLVDALDRFQTVLPALVAGLDDEAVRWRPPTGHWSILEIVCHLADEEIEDFRKRVELTLRDPAQAWPPIDPEGVAVSRAYNEQQLDEVLQRFVDERQQSVRWLRGLDKPDWDHAYNHPKFGPIQAGEVLAAWAAHDQLHARQIAKRLFELCQHYADPYGVSYAGDWTA
ncbi:MAG: DinB family protein, partial [Pirellulaceae bacterium]